MKAVQQNIDILVEDAKKGAGGGDRTLKERLNDMHIRLNNVKDLLDNSDQVQETSERKIQKADVNVTIAENIVKQAAAELTVSTKLNWIMKNSS